MADIVINEAHKARVEGQNVALTEWPSELADRQKLIGAFFKLQEQEKDAIKKAQAEAKKKIGASDALGKLMKDYGYEKKAIKVIEDLKKITDPMVQARIGRQILEMMKDEGILIPELFDIGATGMNAGQGADKPVFDNTPKGSQTKGLGKAASKATETPPAPQPTPGIDLRVAEAELNLNNYIAAQGGPKPGAKKAEHKRLLQAVEDAKALALSDPGGDKRPATTEGTTPAADNPGALPDVNPNAPTDADLPELPKTDGPVAPEIKAGVDQSAAHIASQVEGAAEVVPPTKPKRSSKAKGEAKAPEVKAETKAALAGPLAPPEEDSEEDPFAPLPKVPTPQIGGNKPSTIQLG
jgi:hypothetical protein